MQRLKTEIAAAQGLLFVTPEYNRSIPGVLKNAIDHASRPYGQSAWAGKPAGVIGVSVGAIGTALAQQHLRNVLAYLDVPTLGQPEAFIQNKEGLFDDNGHIGDGQPQVPAGLDGQVRGLGQDPQRLIASGAARTRNARRSRAFSFCSPAMCPARIRRLAAASSRAVATMSARADASAAALAASPIARPSARTKRTSVMPKKPNTTFR